jgi:hypothetical protein
VAKIRLAEQCDVEAARQHGCVFIFCATASPATRSGSNTTATARKDRRQLNTSRPSKETAKRAEKAANQASNKAEDTL